MRLLSSMSGMYEAYLRREIRSIAAKASWPHLCRTAFASASSTSHMSDGQNSLQGREYGLEGVTPPGVYGDRSQSLIASNVP